MAELEQTAKHALEQEGERLAAHMRREVRRSMRGNTPGKPEWRSEIERNLRSKPAAVMENGISVELGYTPDSQAKLVRAMVVEAGSGSAAGNDPIHAGPTGRSVWDDELAEKHPSRAKTVYNLPDEFNQEGNQFVENAMRIMESEFGGVTDATFAALPDEAYHGKVQVRES